jgi:hypothetical protein
MLIKKFSAAAVVAGYILHILLLIEKVVDKDFYLTIRFDIHTEQ